MERKIHWYSGCFDQIESVYEKASKSESVAKLLSELEDGALSEARAYTPQQFDTLPDQEKEHVMFTLSTMGLAAFSSENADSKILVKLTPNIQKVLCCTVFSILNHLEKSDSTFNLSHPATVLELQIPLGGKKGMFPIELLIVQLYPWLEVTEVSSHEIAADTRQSPLQPASKPQSAAPQKSGFFARLFGRKKSNSNQPKTETPGKAASAESHSGTVAKTGPNEATSKAERFYDEMQQKPSFRDAFRGAVEEITSIITKKQFGVKTKNGEPMTVAAWSNIPETEQLDYIISMGNFSIVPSALLCVDFVEIVPYCIAITLLYYAYTGLKEAQLLDTGENADSTMLKAAIEMLKPCCPKWVCKIL